MSRCRSLRGVEFVAGERLVLAALLALSLACGPNGSRTAVEPRPGSGGASPGSGGTGGTGGMVGSTGGSGSGAPTGGASTSGATGGASTGGAATGGAATGGAITGGAATGGATGRGGTGGVDAASPTPDTRPDTAAPADVPPDEAPPVDMAASTLSMGLVSRWKLDESTGNSTADTTGTNNGMIQGGATWITAGFPGADYPNPGALRFDGNDDRVVLGARNLPPFGGPMTVAFWVNYSGLSGSSGLQVAVGFAGAGGSGARLKLGFKDNQITFWRSGNTDLLEFTAPPAGWHHIVYTRDATTNRLYVDGTQRAMSTTSPESGAMGAAQLGTNTSDDEAFRGDLDEIRVYNRVLTPAEVMSLSAGME